ncbi:MAG: subclass B1 metallo-beta-lactamase, partial [Pricia sp.]|nr:subclass B1 metallo-beta-lactamase [Pricia sp.]
MSKKTKVTFLFLLAFQFSCKSQTTDLAYSSETLKIIPVSENSFVHITYLNTEDFGKVACNGLIYLNNGEAAVFDTPIDHAASEELIQWIEETKKHKITAVVINHFHEDCLGGLAPFHQLHISSYANEKTIELAKKEDKQIPMIGFEGRMDLKIGNQKISNQFLGEAHTRDNI